MRLLLYLVLFSISVLSAIGGQINQTPAKPEQYDVFYGKKSRIYLTGEWVYKLLPCNHQQYWDMVKKNLNLTAASVNTSGWKKLQVPNYVDADYRRPSERGAMFLRKNFELAKAAQGKRCILNFEGVAWEPIIFINGKKAAELKNVLPGFPTEFFQTDITDYIKSGSNNITVALFRNIRAGRVLSSGIYAPALIDVVNPVYAEELLIRTQLPNLAKVKCTLVNATGKPQNAAIEVEVLPWKGVGARTVMQLGRKQLKPGENTLAFAVKINKPIRWDLKNPFLYSLKIKANGKLAGWERFGLREFKVAGRNFYLNGSKVNCYGIAASEGNLSRLMYTEGTNPQFLNNIGDCLRKYLKLLKRNNCASIMRWPVFTKTMNDICDEEGILNFHMVLPFKQAKDMPLWIKRMIVNKKRAIPETLSHGFFYEKVDGKLKRCGREIFDVKGRDHYLKLVYNKIGKVICNSPSVVAILNGDENFRSCNQAFDMPTMRKSLYEICPGMVFAGEHGIGASSTTLDGTRVPVAPKQDFVNYAGANCGGAAMNVCHFSMYPFTLKWRFDAYNKNVYPQPKPAYADESFYYGELRNLDRAGLYNWIKRSYSAMYKDGKLDVNQMVKILGEPSYAKIQAIPDRYKSARARYAAVKGAWWPYRRFIKLAGLHVDIFDKQTVCEVIARRLKKMAEITRIYDQYMQGVGAVTGPWFNYDMKKLQQLDPSGIQPGNPIGEMFRLVYSPLFCCISLYADKHSFIAGDKFNTKIYAFNNSGTDAKDVKVELTLSGAGGVAFSKTTKFGNLKAGGKLARTITIPFASKLKTGDYKITLKMLSGNKKILTNPYQVFVLGNADAHPRINCSQTVYVLRGKNSRLNKNLTALLGNIVGLKVKYIDNIEMLKDGKYLIVGPRALTKANTKQLAGLNVWLKKGGRMLCLAQSLNGPVPWLPAVSIFDLTGKFGKYFQLIGIDLMPVQLNYPAFDKIAKRHYWNSFNSKNGEIYRTLMTPLDKDAKAIGADVGQGEHPRCFGALLTEKKVGSGTCILSQTEAVKAFGSNDGVATRYLYNLVKHLTSK